MKKQISAVLISALMVLTMFTALVPAASAVEEVSAPYEFMGVVNATGVTSITATSRDNPSILFYDIDDKDGNETLTLPIYSNTTIPDGELLYTTSFWMDEGSTYVAWSGNKYAVVQNTSSKWIISEKLVDEDDDDDHLLRVGESLSLAEGFGITALEIDVDGGEAWLSLTKDGEEVENAVVNEDPAKGSVYFTYEEDLGASDDTEVMNFTVETVFAGMNTNLVKINDIDLISTETLEVKNNDKDLYDDYVIKTTATQITIENDEDIGLGEDDVTEIVGGLFAVRVNEDSTKAGVVKILTEPGIYELMGAVNGTSEFNISANSSNNPAILYYDLDDKEGKETLFIPTYINGTMPDGEMKYTTSFWMDEGSTYVAWSGNKYAVVQNTSSKWIISEKLVDEDDDDDHLLRVGESLSLAEGFGITALEIDVDGGEAWLSLTKDGEEVENAVVNEDAAKGSIYFTYEEDLGAADDTEVMNFTVETVFAGMNTNLVKINDIDLISTETLEVKNNDKDLYNDYVIKTTATQITIENDEDIGLGEDDVTEIVGGLFSVRVNEDSTLMALVKIVNVGGVTPTATPTSVTPTATATEVGTDGGEDGTEDGTAAPTAEPTEEPTEEPTPEPTEEPGFEAVFAVAGLLAVAYLVLRQRD